MTETEISLVETMSIEILWRAKMSKIRARKPCPWSIRGVVMVRIRLCRLWAIDLGPFAADRDSARIGVPGWSGLKVFRHRTGIFFRTAGVIVAGWRTLPP